MLDSPVHNQPPLPRDTGKWKRIPAITPESCLDWWVQN